MTREELIEYVKNDTRVLMLTPNEAEKYALETLKWSKFYHNEGEIWLLVELPTQRKIFTPLKNYVERKLDGRWEHCQYYDTSPKPDRVIPEADQERMYSQRQIEELINKAVDEVINKKFAAAFKACSQLF